MQHAFGIDVPMTLEDVCHPQKMALLVYDMQVGIAGQLLGSEAFIQQVKTITVSVSRSFPVNYFEFVSSFSNIAVLA